MTRFTALISIIVALWHATATAASFYQDAPPARATVIVPVANLRTGPGTDFAVAAKAKAGQQLHIIACNDDCSWVQLEGALWIAASLLEPVNDKESVATAGSTATSSATARVAANLRTGPGTSYALTGGVVPGQPLPLVARNEDGSWYQLENGAWIAAFLVDNAPSQLPSANSTTPASPDATSPAAHEGPSATLAAHAAVYVRIAQANVRTIGARVAVVPSPVYANGIYARDAFYTVLGLGDLALSEQAYRWFESAQNAQSGQITTAIAFDPADSSLQPQDDETTLLFLIWSGLMQRDGRPVNAEVVGKAWRFVQAHVSGGLYTSQPGQFRYWADCWRLDQADVITYNQGLYAIAARFLADAQLAEVTPAIAAEAANGYRALFGAGFLPLSANAPGNNMQDLSALLPEFLHRYFFNAPLLADADVLSTVDHQLATLAVYAPDGSAAGLKNIANADGSFAPSSRFACPTQSTAGDYHNGGYWPMYTLVELALAYRLDAQPIYRSLLETLIAKEVAGGTTSEYWSLMPGHIGQLQPGRADYSWNVLVVPALRWAGLIP